MLQWGARTRNGFHICHHCGLQLLTGECSGFCCGPNGKYANDLHALPPLPHEYNTLISDSRISKESRILNLIFSFASVETTHEFPNLTGPPSFVAVQGKVYHWIRPTHQNSSLRWLLFDGFMQDKVPFPDKVAKLPSTWIPSIRNALLCVNPFVRQLRQLSEVNIQECPNASLNLQDRGMILYIKRIYH